MARENNSYFSILGILGFGPMSGYQIKAWVDNGVSFFWEIDYKQIYPTLKKLVEEGLATYTLEKSRNRLDKKVYSITDKGLSELKDWLSKPIKDGRQSTSELKLKLFFGHHVSLEKNLEHIKSFQELTVRRQREVEKIQKLFEEDPVRDASWHYRLTTVMNGIIQYNADLDWCSKITEYLKNAIPE